MERIIYALTGKGFDRVLRWLGGAEAKLILGRDSIQPRQTLQKLPDLSYPELDKFLLRYANSHHQAGRVNGQQLAFVVGPHHIGKTQFVTNNLKRIRDAKDVWHKGAAIAPESTYVHSPELLEEERQEVVHSSPHFLPLTFDFSRTPLLSFPALLELFHSTILSEIVALSGSFLTTPLLGGFEVGLIVTHCNSPTYVLVYCKETIHAILEGTDDLELSPKALQELEALNEHILEDSETAFFDLYYPKLLTLISNDKNCTELEAALRFFYSVHRHIEFEHRPHQPYPSRPCWSGIETTDFLFNVLDHLCGFGPYNEAVVHAHLNPTPTSPSTSPTHTSISSPTNITSPSANYIHQGNHIDVLMSLLNISELECYNTQQFWQLIDHIVCRHGSTNNLRKHFPILIELPDSATLVELQKLGRLDPEEPVILELHGYEQYEIHKSNLTALLTEEAAIDLFPDAGRHPLAWRRLIARLAEGTSLKDFREGRHSAAEAEYTCFEARFNSVFTNAEVQPLLNSGTLHCLLMEALHLTVKNKGYMDFSITTHYHGNFLEQPHVQALMRAGLLNQTYYLSLLLLPVRTDLYYARRLLQACKQHLGLRYSYWKLFQRQHTLFWLDLRYRKAENKDRFNYRQHWRRRASYPLQTTYFGNLQNYQAERAFVDTPKQLQ